MMKNPILTRLVCWLCVMAMVGLCLVEAGAAQTLEDSDDIQLPDSTAVEPETPGIYDTISPVQPVGPDSTLAPSEAASPFYAPDDTLSAGENGGQPVYKRWWVWALAVVAVGVLVGLAGGGSSTKDEDLPDFPDPPER